MGLLSKIINTNRQEQNNKNKIRKELHKLEMEKASSGMRKHESFRKEKVDASVAILEEILASGVGQSEERQLEYFFYAESMESAEKMQQWVTDGKYDTKPIQEANGRYLVNGLSTPKKMDVGSVKNWVHNMCNAGMQNDAQFDTWGLGK